MKTCVDIERDHKWNTDYCCGACHDPESKDGDHRLTVEWIEGEQVQGCIPLFEHLLYGFDMEDTSA